jgi:hypothetical protein
MGGSIFLGHYSSIFTLISPYTKYRLLCLTIWNYFGLQWCGGGQ